MLGKRYRLDLLLILVIDGYCLHCYNVHVSKEEVYI